MAVVNVNRGKIKVLYLKNKNKSFEEMLSILYSLNVYDCSYYITFLDDDTKRKLLDHYCETIEKKTLEETQGLYQKIYYTLFVTVTVALSLEEYNLIKELFDKFDMPKKKGIVSLIFTIIEYYLSGSDYKSILRLMYVLSICIKFKKYLLKQTFDYLRYITEIEEEDLFKKTLRILFDRDIYTSYRLFVAATNNLNISFKDGIEKYFEMSLDDFETAAFSKYYQMNHLVLIYYLYSQKYGMSSEEFYGQIDNIYEKIRSFESNSKLTMDGNLFKEKQYFLYKILRKDFSKYEIYKEDLFKLFNDDLFQPMFVYHEIDYLFRNAIMENKILELLDNMPRNPYGYDEKMINIRSFDDMYKLFYLKNNYKGIFSYLKKYSPEAIIRIYMNTSLRIIIDFNEIIDFIINNYNDFGKVNEELSKYYFYGSIIKSYSDFYLWPLSVCTGKSYNLSDERHINSFYDFYFENRFKVRFKFLINKKAKLISYDIEYLLVDNDNRRNFKTYDRYIDVYENALMGEISDDDIAYLKRCKYAGYLGDIFKIYNKVILGIDESNYDIILKVLESDNISVFNKKNYNLDYQKKVWYILKDVCDAAEIQHKWEDILKLNIDNSIKFSIYENSIFRFYIKLEDVLDKLGYNKLPDGNIIFTAGVSGNILTPFNFRTDEKIMVNTSYKKVWFRIYGIKNGHFILSDVRNLETNIKKLSDLNNYLKKYNELKRSDFLPHEVILNINDLFYEVFSKKYADSVKYFELITEAYYNLENKEELLKFISTIGKNSIFNEEYPMDYSIYSMISDDYKMFLDKVVSFGLSLEEAIRVYKNSPLKYGYFIAEFLRDYFKFNPGTDSILDLTSYDIYFDVFVLDKKDVSECIFNEKKVKVKISSDFEEGSVISLKATKYELFKGLIHAEVTLKKEEVSFPLDIQKQFEDVLLKMKNFNIGDEQINFDYIDAYRFNLININEFLKVYFDVFLKNIRDLNFLYDFTKKITSMNLFLAPYDGDDSIFRRMDVFRFKYFNKQNFLSRIKSNSMLNKYIYISRNSLMKISYRYLINDFLKNVGSDKYSFSNNNRLKVYLNVFKYDEYCVCSDRFNNKYNINFNGMRGISPNYELFASFKEFVRDGNYFNVSLKAAYSVSDMRIRYFLLHIDELLRLLDKVYSETDNLNYYLYNISKICKRRMIVSKVVKRYQVKIMEYLILYNRIFEKYIFDLETLNKILLSLGQSSPFEITNDELEIGLDSFDMDSIVSKFKDSVLETSSYFDAVSVYFNSYLKKYISVLELKELFDRNTNEKFNSERNSLVFYVKHVYNDFIYFVSYDGKLKIKMNGVVNKKPYAVFKLKDFKVIDNELTYSRKLVVSEDNKLR